MNIELTGPRLTQLVGQFVPDVLIEDRLRRYPEIAAHFSGHLAESRARSSCCHQMAWRLGTWRSEAIFGRLEEMLRQAKTMPGWEGEQGMFANTQYRSFWSLVWQLQVAECLAGFGFSPKWNNPGPDLLIEVDGHQVWLECYSTVGFYEPVEFLGEILPRIHPELKVDNSPSDRSASPDVSDGAFLETCVVTVESKLPAALEDCRTGTWPILLYASPDGAISVRLYGEDIARYDSSLDRRCTVDFERHFRRAILQAFRKKIGKNGLASNRPNVVIINLVVNELFQVPVDPVRHLSEEHSALIPSRVVTGLRDLDAAIWKITGVDEKLTTRTSQCVWKLADHPLRTIVVRASAA